MSDESPADRLAALSPSAKLVAKVLEHHESLTQQELTETTRLPQRTVRDALDRLGGADLVTAAVSLRDARQRHYTLTDLQSE